MALTEGFKLRKRSGLEYLTNHVSAEFGLTKRDYKFGLLKIQKKRRKVKLVTICLFKVAGNLYHTKAILNDVEDEFYGPAGELEAFRRFYQVLNEFGFVFGVPRGYVEEVTPDEIHQVVAGELDSEEIYFDSTGPLPVDTITVAEDESEVL